MASETKTNPYQIFMLVLSIISLVLLGISLVFSLSPATETLINYADNAICVLFFVDFLILFYRAENKVKYFFTWGWLDLLSSIPLLDAFRLGRASRIVRILRVLRGLRAARLFTTFIVEKRTESGLLSAVLVVIVLVLLSSLAILQFEAGAEGNIQTAGDALWWSLTSITTVGYGDHFPVTPEGRVVAVGLMFAGISLFGVLSGFLAAWFVAPNSNKQQVELETLHAELAEIKQLLAQLNTEKSRSA
jgi:voltage-gated potassium channel